ncbi:hypothetical protein BZM27_16035 [Paraburkholderia steynii]|uniref:Uncharacterized protein n=1 Tax=Paraburkholderia steynii TaxID=1245441 RepID=A0A4R0XKX3_9BURK|nr:hypothetical protein BZM27_16035 [Paraburkholderia steynii]
MARLQDLQEELERLGREIEEEIMHARRNPSCTPAPSDETPVDIRLTTPRDVRLLQISISIERSIVEPQG